MSDAKGSNLGTVPAANDPGDETARRFRYQWTYAAIACCMLLDDSYDVEEVFCEHHEDVLLKHGSGSYTGVQVKTRSADQATWKAKDRAILDSCARFARLEVQFPGQFCHFKFLTNHPLHSSRNGQDLKHVLTLIKAARTISDLNGVARQYISKVAQKAGHPDEKVHLALSKASASDDLPKLSDAENRLAATLTSVWRGAESCSYAALMSAARALVEECGRASSLAHADTLPSYLPLACNPGDAELAARLEGKRFGRERLDGILDRGASGTAPLHSSPEICVQPGGGSRDLLEKKLDAGGFSAVSLNSAQNLRNKADYLGLVGTKKHGPKGLQRYEHIRTLVLSDAATAYENTRKPEVAFGREMLGDLRARLEERVRGSTETFDWSKEHLEGLAYSLTAQCELQWSVDRPWEIE